MPKLSSLVFAVAVALPGAACGPSPRSTTPAAAASDALVVVPRAPAVGMRATVADDLAIAMTFTAMGQAVDTTQTRTTTTHVEVLEVGADAATRLRVHYETKRMRVTEGGQTRESAGVLDGKQFEVWRTDGRLAAVRLEAGGTVEPSAEELEALEKDHDDLGQVPGIVRLLAARPWPRGVKVELAGDDLRLLGPGFGAGSFAPTGGALTFVGAQGDVASAEITLTMADGQGLEMAMTAAMTFDVARTLPLEVATTGTISGVAQTPQGAFPVEGTITGRKTYAYP